MAGLHQKTKDRRNIGKVVFLSEKMEAARELSSCCVGTEALLENDRVFTNLMQYLFKNRGGKTD